MKVDTMRKIDRYVGIPLCFFSTIIFKIFLRKKPKKPKRILFIELSEMGSAIIADPAMRKAAKVHSAELFFLIFEKNKPSLKILNTIPDENIFTIRPSLVHILFDTLRFLVWARKNKIDTAIDIELFSRYTALLTGFCGASNTVGFYRYYTEGLYRGNMLSHKVAYNPCIHIAKNFIALVNSLSEDPKTTPMSKTLVDNSEMKLTQVKVLEEAKNKMYELIDEAAPAGWRTESPRILLVNPNASDLLPQRRWPRENFVEFIKIMLAQHQDVLVLLTGAKNESDLADSIVKDSLNDRCVNFTGKGSLKDMITLYSISSAMLTNDSGPGHFSSVTNLPVVVMFGPETPALYGSLGNATNLFLGLSCSPCVSAANHRKTTCQDNICLKKITPESVALVVSNILKNNE